MLEFREGWKLWLTMDGEVVVNSLVDWHDVQGGVVRIYWHRGCIQQLDIKAYLEILYSISAESITLDATQFYTLHLNVSARENTPLTFPDAKLFRVLQDSNVKDHVKQLFLGSVVGGVCIKGCLNVLLTEAAFTRLFDREKRLRL
jgi:hypothetical protein